MPHAVHGASNQISQGDINIHGNNCNVSINQHTTATSDPASKTMQLVFLLLHMDVLHQQYHSLLTLKWQMLMAKKRELFMWCPHSEQDKEVCLLCPMV